MRLAVPLFCLLVLLTACVAEDVSPDTVAENCVPACDGKFCGSDGCGGKCGECTGFQLVCVEGFCKCIPSCVDKKAGEDDGCCGICPEGSPGYADICSPPN